MDPRRHLLRNAWITLVASLALATVLALPGRVSAANLTFDYGVVTVPTTLYWGPPSSPSANGFLHGPSELFIDHILFQTSSPFTAQLFNNFNNFSNFSQLSVSLRDDVTHVVAYAADPNTPTAPFAWSNATPSGSIVAGSYQLHITGTMAASITPNPTGESGGIILGAATAPIPEPETYAMMLAGLGLMGFVARRRRQK